MNAPLITLEPIAALAEARIHSLASLPYPIQAPRAGPLNPILRVAHLTLLKSVNTTLSTPAGMPR